MVVSLQWCGAGNIHDFGLDGKSYQQGWTDEDNNVAFTNVQPHYYRVRQVRSQALFLSILALSGMPKQQQ